MREKWRNGQNKKAVEGVNATAYAYESNRWVIFQEKAVGVIGRTPTVGSHD